MDKLLIENICEKYPIGDIVSYEKVKGGNTAETFLINSKSKKWILRKLKGKAQGDAEFTIMELYLKTAGNNEIIHGDLGIWNMIWTNNEIKIIDFGESRMGDYYFDIADALCSSIGYNESIKKVDELYRAFIDTYSQNSFKINTSKLLSYIRLWYWRGILSVLNNEQFDTNKKENVIKLSLDIIHKYNIVLIS